jgi:CheY-like chemotaxis protein
MRGRLSAIRAYAPEAVASAELMVNTGGEGFLEITGDVAGFVEQCGAGEGGVLLYLRHTSASLVIQENADPDVQTDLLTALRRVAIGSMSWLGAVYRSAACIAGLGSCRIFAGLPSAAVGRRVCVCGGEALTDPLYRLVIADDHPLFRGALRAAVGGLVGSADILEAGSFDELAKGLDDDGEVDLILLDLAMPGVRGFSGLMFLRAQYPSVPVMVVSANDDPAVIRRCMDFGASGFIPKTLGIEQMRQAVKCVLGGGIWTPPLDHPPPPRDQRRAAASGRRPTLISRWRRMIKCRR